MDGFVRSVRSTQPMGFHPPEVLPFAYSLPSVIEKDLDPERAAFMTPPTVREPSDSGPSGPVR